VISTTPDFEQQFARCLPHSLAASKIVSPPEENPPGAVSQSQVSLTVASGNYSAAYLDTPPNGHAPTIHFDIFDALLNLLTETNFTLPDPRNQSFFNLKLADVNRDGNPDLLSFSATGIGHGNVQFGLWVFLGNGDGTFQSPLQRDMGTYSGAVSAAMTVADVNGDGKPDIAIVANSIGHNGFVLLGNGDGTFLKRDLALGSLGTLSSSLSLADLNGDGKADLVVTTNSAGTYIAAVAVELGNGDATFQSPILFPIQNGDSHAPITLAIGDVDGDHIPDILSSTGSILFGDGKGGFPSRRDYALNGSGTVMLADFDGDGVTDILIGGGNPAFLSGSAALSLTVLFGQGDGTFVGAPVSGAGISGINFTGQSLIPADFNADGIPDLVLADRTDIFIAVLQGEGNGEFTSVYNLNLVGRSAVSIAAADFNGDGKADIAALMDVAPFSSGEVQVFFGNGDGTFVTPIVLPLSAHIVSFLAALDLNGDGIADLVASAQNTVSVWLGKAGGTFSSPVSYSVQGGYLISGGPVSLAFGDFNGDGRIDIAIPSQVDGTISLLLGKGNGNFSLGAIIPLSLTVVPGDTRPGGPTFLAAADFNGDGRLDIAATLADSQNILSGGVAILLGKGDGTFEFPTLNPEPATGIAIANLNRDGVPDLIVTGQVFGTAVVLGNGDGTFSAPLTVFSQPLESLAVADFNNDGSADIAGGLITIGVAGFLNITEKCSSVP
jgi:hypothetical protein